MNNLFHYKKDFSPTNDCAKVLLKWEVVKNKHLLYEALDEYFRARLVLSPNPSGTPRPHPLWRITIPLWALAFVLIAFVVLPVKWLFTGRYKLDQKGRSFQWLKTWHQRMFPWPAH